MKNIIKKFLSLFILSLLVLSAITIISSQEAKASNVSPSLQQTMPYTIKYAFLSGAYGPVQFADNYYFVSNSYGAINSNIYVYNSMGVEVSVISGSFSVFTGKAISNTEVFLSGYNEGVYYFGYYNISTELFSGPNEYSNTQFIMPNGMGFGSVYGAQTTHYFSSVNYYYSQGSNKKWYPYAQWLNESNNYYTGMTMFNPFTGKTEYLNMSSFGLYNFGYLSDPYYQNLSSSPTLPAYTSSSIGFTPFYIASLKSYDYFIPVNNYTFIIPVDLVKNVVLENTTTIYTAQNGILEFNFSSMNINYIPLSSYPSYLNNLIFANDFSTVIPYDSLNGYNFELFLPSAYSPSKMPFNLFGNNIITYDNNIYIPYKISTSYIDFGFYEIQLNSSTPMFFNWNYTIKLSGSYPALNNSFVYYNGIFYSNIITGSTTLTYYLIAIKILPNGMPIAVFDYPILNGDDINIYSSSQGLLLFNNNNEDIYLLSVDPLYPLKINIIPQSLSGWNVTINPIYIQTFGSDLNKTIVNSASFTVNLFPITYSMNISAPKGYYVYSIQYSKGLQSSIQSSQVLLQKQFGFVFNITTDPTVNITFVPYGYNATFNLNGFIAGSKSTIEIYHGTNPSVIVFNGTTLPLSNSNATNYTLTYTSSTNVVSFYLANGTYSYSASVNEGIITAGQSGTFTISGKSVSITITIVGGYKVIFTETGLAKNTVWSITLAGTTETSNTSSITFYELNGSYTYMVNEPKGYNATPSYGTVNVNGQNINIPIIFTAITTSGGIINSYTTIQQFVGQNWLWMIILTIASILIGWVLSIYVNPKENKKSTKSKKNKKGRK